MLKFIINFSLFLNIHQCQLISFLVLDQKLQIQQLISRLLRQIYSQLHIPGLFAHINSRLSIKELGIEIKVLNKPFKLWNHFLLDIAIQQQSRVRMLLVMLIFAVKMLEVLD